MRVVAEPAEFAQDHPRRTQFGYRPGLPRLGVRGLPWYTAHMDRRKALKAVGDRIRKLREARGVSQEEAARLAGIDRSYYGRIERGLINVSAVYLLRIADMLHCHVGMFFPPA